MASQDYERSVRRALSICGGLAGLAAHLTLLPEKVSGLVPFDVVALTSVQVADTPYNDKTMVAAYTLALRGYDEPTSFSIWEGFRDNFPDFNAEIAMLMSKDTLQDTFGRVNGELLANMLLDPASQPILHALMLGSARPHPVDGLVTVVERECVSVQFRCQGELRDAGGGNAPVRAYSSPWQVGDAPVKIMSPAAAAHAYAQATDGGRLPSKSGICVSPEFLNRGPR